MKYVPAPPSFVFEPITTPNKNIQSYFMRSDQSYYTEEALRYPKYCTSDEQIQILIDDGVIQICGRRYEVDFFKNYRLNLEKYGVVPKCLDGIYSLLFNDIKRRRAIHDGNASHTVDSPLCERLISKDEQVNLIVGDFFGRSEIVSFIDVVINQLGFKIIMVLPISLCMSFDLNQNYCSFVYRDGFSFIDDFTLVDTFACNPDSPASCMSKNSIRVDDEDFAEEFSRLSVIDEKLRYTCDECGQKEESLEKIQSHMAKEHREGTYYFYESPSAEDMRQSVNECFKSRARYLFSKEKYEKISKKVFSIGIDFEGSERVPSERASSDSNENITVDHYETAIRGAQAFSGLEVSRDLWMTEHEWRHARLRSLKEKMLFYI